MQLSLYILCFLDAYMATFITVLAYHWYTRMREQIKQAEATRQEMEVAMIAFENEQKVVLDELRSSLADLISIQVRGQEFAAAMAASVPQTAANPAPNSIKERLKKAVELTNKQFKIDTKRGPESVLQNNELELEKLAILKTILADGHDPVVTIHYSAGDQDMLLSAYVQSISKGLA